MTQNRNVTATFNSSISPPPPPPSGTACNTAYPADAFYVCYFDGITAPTTAVTALNQFTEATLLSPVGGWSGFNHDFGTGAVGGTTEIDTVSGVWRGRINFQAGTYTFHTISDDGVELNVEGQGNVISNWTDHAPIQNDSSALVLSGQRDVTLRWYESGGGARVNLWWDFSPSAAVPNPPTLSSVSNSTCERLTLTWTDNSADESGFRVYRTTTSGSGYTNVSGDLAANTTTYQDTPPAVSVNYYYVIRAFNAAGESANSNEESAFNLPCQGTLSPSVKTLQAVNGVAYNTSTQIKAGDTVTYQITVINSGPSNVIIDYICDNPSSNLTNIRNLTITESDPINTPVNGGISQNDPTCIAAGQSGLRFNISGTKDVTYNWLIRFDATYTATSSNAYEPINNNAVIFYHDASGNKQKIVAAPTVLSTNSQANVPVFQEVAP
jgi:uncharacterized repeat protein (TIGR01451 family)